MMEKVNEQLEIGDRLNTEGLGGLHGCKIVQATKERTVLELKTEPAHLNPLGIVHGGVLATLIDNAMGITAKCLYPNYDSVTTNLNVHFVHALGLGTIKAEAVVLHASRSTITLQGTVTNEEGKIGTVATGSFRVLHHR